MDKVFAYRQPCVHNGIGEGRAKGLSLSYPPPEVVTPKRACRAAIGVYNPGRLGSGCEGQAEGWTQHVGDNFFLPYLYTCAPGTYTWTTKLNMWLHKISIKKTHFCETKYVCARQLARWSNNIFTSIYLKQLEALKKFQRRTRCKIKIALKKRIKTCKNSEVSLALDNKSCVL